MTTREGYRLLTESECAQIRAMREDDCPIREIARTLDRSAMTVSQFCKREGISPTRRGGHYLNRADKQLADQLGLPTC